MLENRGISNPHTPYCVTDMYSQELVECIAGLMDRPGKRIPIL